ncbi:MAG: amino acid adenylation domain-containing protein [Candidatus Aminicenantes bacterium]|nr:amino acid adenylation domain-containing protein [Candidatus Aminicenantes bacterium]NIN19600.1 amino acid adenylation domain-containing protein [Candidatus Aminicenantes bacterium]NIO82529.1 amino acid adenylation domain-containing protein [Candidatus Aminicenantes bacterium]NIQ68391.1 amino acid adenylation domain-containing protein [Candidatus Aminicenantes bacterium]NIT24434.1 amino acid adenylation domain-containing protein [Candidatus Aminicenantes bacterium]
MKTYKEHLLQLRTVAAKKAKEKDYWLNKLSGELVKSSFPTCYKREGAAEQPPDTVSFEFSQELSAGLLKLSAGSDIRLHIILVAGLTLLINKYTGLNDIIVGSPIWEPDIKQKLINTVLALRNQLTDTMTFKELLLEVRKTLIEANENRNYPIEVLADQLNMPFEDNGFPLFDAAIIVENVHAREYLDRVHPNMIFSLLREDSMIAGHVDYNPSLYDEGGVKGIICHFKNLLQKAQANTDVKTVDIEILTEEEKKQLLKDFNDTSESYPWDKTIHELFEEQVKRTPDSIALVGSWLLAIGKREKIHITYGVLNEKADRLAHVLQQKGVGPDSIAGLMVERSLEMIIGILGILKAGGAYLPIDPDYPEDRITYMLKDSNARLLLAAPAAQVKVEVEVKEDSIELIDISNELSSSTSTLASISSPASSADGLAYIIYTSGSTGRPKGVAIRHFSVVNLAFSQKRYFNITVDDRILQFSSICFDASVEQIFISLFSGSCLFLVDRDTILNSKKFEEFIASQEITHLHAVPSFLNAMRLKSTYKLKRIIAGGDVCPVSLAQKWSKYCEFYNEYGPTETTVTSVELKVNKVNDRWARLPVGKPIGNTFVFLFDKQKKLVAPGIPGELYIGGEGVGRGYLNRPALTAETFILAHRSWLIADRRRKKVSSSGKLPMSYELSAMSCLYKTGDLARWLPDGNLEFLGRLDNQVKIRGFRIELGEIENRLVEHNAIAEAVVISKESEAGDRYLCAYFVGVDRVGSADLKEYLSQTLPDYMIPGYFVKLEKIPLNPNGKVDVKALPKPEMGIPRREYIAPRDEIEEKLVEIWEEVLNIDRNLANAPIGIDDKFFELGGHSLRATTLVYRIYQEFEINIEIGDVFTYPSIRELGQRIKESEVLAYIEIIPSEEKDYYPLSYAQRRLWVLCQFEEDSTAYNIPAAVFIDGPFDVETFIQAVQALAERHESLKTIFTLVEGDPYQKIIRGFKFNLEHVDLQNLNEAEKQKNARQLYLQVANSAFNLEHGPLFCFKLVRLEDEKYLLIYNIHHIISDGWSQGNINNELITLYNTFLKSGENPLPPLKLQYKDYSRWHNQLTAVGSFNQSQDYWLEKFKDKPNGIELPLDHPRKAIQTFNGGRVPFVIDKERTQQLYQLSLEEDVTLFMSLLSMLNVFLYKYTGQGDIIIGAPIANRKQPELYPMIGFLVNTLVYRNRVNPEQCFRDLLSSIKQETLDCYNYQDYPFDLLVEELELDRDLSQSPLFNVMLAHNNAETDDSRLVMEGVTISGYSHSDDFNMSKFDLIFFMDEADGQVYTRIEYNSDLFEHSTIERMKDNFLALTDDVIARSDVPVSALHILCEAESQNVIEAFNDTRYSFPSLTLQELFEQQVERCGDKTAVVSQEHHGWHMDAGAMHMTYNELNKKANQLAHYLKDQCGIKANDAIGVSMERSIDMIVVLLGIIKSGAAYLAVDPTYPQDRVLHVLSDSQSDFLIIDKMRPELFGNYEGRIIDVHCQWDKISEKSTDNPPTVNQPSDILYINYTSGSTGTPNGAMLSHDCLTNLINWQDENTLIDGALSCLQFTSINFCVSFQEIMGTLTSGGQLHLIGDLERQDIDYLMDFLSRHQIELLFLPFSYLNFLFNESGRWHQSFAHNLKHITTAGEQLKITAGLKRFLDLNPGLKLHNHYGSTEMHVVTSYTLDASTAEKTPIPPAGKPISNVSIYTLDEHLNPVPVGVWGELFVKGSSEVLGYINNEDLTGEKLVYHPEFSEENNRLYRSGDIGRWLPDGNIELRGRKDFMVKVRGFRIELGEIESKILSIERVRECVVVVKENNKGEKTLFAYVSVDNISESEIKRIISNDLPQYMVPQIIILASLPLMPNGKVDRESLPEPRLDMEQEYAAPRDELEKKLAGIWSEVLNIERIGIDDNFFELGGHSLKATTLVSRVHKIFDFKVPLADFFKQPTVRELAEFIKSEAEIGERETFVSIEAAEKREYYGLSSAQKRLYILQQTDLQSTSYNMPSVMWLEGVLEEARLEKAFGRLIQRHESLRTSFAIREGEPVQRVHDRVEFEIEWSPLDQDKGSQGELPLQYNEIIRDFIRSFDLSQPPLLRLGLIKTEEQKHILMVDMHHIITDGTSMGIVVREFMALYADAAEELSPLPIQYKDFSEWKNSESVRESMRKQEAYWLKEFDGEIPLLNLITDYPRSQKQNFEGRAAGFELTGENSCALKGLAKEEDVTVYMVLLAIYNVLLSKLSTQEDIIVGTPVAGRSHTDLQPLIGMFVNTLALRNYPVGEKTFREFLKEIKKRTLEAFENQDYPFEDLAENVAADRDPGRNPLFDAMFSLQNLDIPKLEIPGLQLKPYKFETRISKFDLCLTGIEVDEKFKFIFEYKTTLFKDETIEEFIRYFKDIATVVVENRDIKLNNIDLSTDLTDSKSDSDIYQEFYEDFDF